jgi:hypothetical protein
MRGSIGNLRRRCPKQILVLLVLASVGSLMLSAPSSAWANNDPHRVYLPASPFDIAPDVCGFTVHVDVPVARQYGKFSEAEDGSTVVKITGSLVWALTNVTNGNSITLNASGPGTIIFPIDTTLAVVDASGLNLVYVTNGAQFGVPNFMYSSGLLQFTTDLSNDTLVSLDRKPHVLLDVCAALS